MKRSESINEIATALSKAQEEMSGAVKDSSNPFFKSKYADLASVRDAIKDPFSKNGISYVQTIEMNDKGPVLITTLMHSSGQWIESDLQILPVKPDPQSMGSALTYARRYALAAIAGVPQVDDDAELAQGRQVVQQRPQQLKPPVQSPVTTQAVKTFASSNYNADKEEKYIPKNPSHNTQERF